MMNHHKNLWTRHISVVVFRSKFMSVSCFTIFFGRDLSGSPSLNLVRPVQDRNKYLRIGWIKQQWLSSKDVPSLLKESLIITTTKVG